MARLGLAWPGLARQGKEHGQARRGMAWHCTARPGTARHGPAWPGKARRGKARNMARQGVAGPGKARQGKVNRRGSTRPPPNNSKGDNMKSNTRVEIVTPEKAREYLKKNTRNRRLRKGHILYLVEVIRRGEWMYNGHPIIFGEDGVLLDGQHRLWACVQSGKPIITLIVRSVNPESYDTQIETQRDKSDLTGLSKSMCAMLRSYWAHELLKVGRKTSPDEDLELYESKKQYFDVMESLRTHDRALGLASVWAAMVRYCEENTENAIKFANAFIDPTSTVTQAQMLRNYLFNRPSNNGFNFQREVYEKAVYCMQAHDDNREISQVRRARW